eukprot:EG_transcript_8075
MARAGPPLLALLLLVLTPAPATGASPATPPLLEAWVPLPAMKHGADGVAAAAIDNNLYVFGGSTNNNHSSSTGIKLVAVLDTAGAEKAWKPLPGLSAGRCCAAAQAVADEVFLIGGMLNEEVYGDVEVFNATTKVWGKAPPLATPRCCMAWTVFNHEIWVLGGGDSRGYALESIEVYSPKTKRWKESPIKLTEPRTFFGAATHDDSIVIVGGQVNYDAHTCVQKFYPGNPGRGWVNLAPPSFAHRAFAFASHGDYLYVLGGMGKDTGLEPINKVEVYDMRHDEWYTLTDLPGPRDCSAAVILKEHLLAIGGFGPTDKSGKVLADVLEARIQLPKGKGSKGSKKGGDVPDAPKRNHHVAFWLLFLVILGGAIYGGGGAALNYREGARGIEMVPHHEFWMEFPALLMDGLVFSAAAVTAMFRPLLTRLGLGGRYETLPEDENPW